MSTAAGCGACDSLGSLRGQEKMGLYREFRARGSHEGMRLTPPSAWAGVAPNIDRAPAREGS